MKRHPGLIVLSILLALCVGGAALYLRATAEYPVLGEPVSYPVNQIEGFDLSIEAGPTWSPFRGYTLKYSVRIDSQEVYHLTTGNEPHCAETERLERLVDGQWCPLRSTEPTGFQSNTFDLGGPENTGFYGSLVQKYEGYGTRLEPGTYRLVLELTDHDGRSHCLAAEFPVD